MESLALCVHWGLSGRDAGYRWFWARMIGVGWLSAHASPRPSRAYRGSPSPLDKLLDDPSSAVTALIGLTNGYSLLFHGFAAGVDLIGSIVLPVIIATAADG